MFRGLYFLGNNCIIPYKFHSAYSLHVDYSPQNDHSLFSDYTLCSMYFHRESFSYYICRELSSIDILKIFSDTWISAHYICEICSKHRLLIHIFRIFFYFRAQKKSQDTSQDQMTPTRFELVIPPWKGGVLTAWPWRQREARVGFEPALRVLQTHALPLGYLAIKYILKKQIGLRQASMS